MSSQALASVDEGSITPWKVKLPVRSTVSTTSDYPLFKDYRWYLAGRALYPRTGEIPTCHALSRPENADPTKLLFVLYIGGKNENYLIQTFKNEWQFTKHDYGRTAKWTWHGYENPVTLGPADDVWTVNKWVDVSTCELSDETGLPELKTELRALLDDFRAGNPLDRPQALMNLAAKVAKQSQQPDDKSIETWAQELSEKLSNLTD